MDNKVKDLTRVGLGITIMFLFAWVYTFFIGKNLSISENLKSLVSSILLYVVGSGLFIYITKDISEKDYAKGELPFKTFLTCFFLQFTALLIFTLVSSLLVSVTKKAPAERDNLSLHMLFSLLIFAPVVEEIVFRHLFARKLLEYGDAFYVFVSSFCFSLVHGVSIGIPSIIYTFILGLIWSYLLVKTGDIKITIVFALMWPDAMNLKTTYMMMFNSLVFTIVTTSLAVLISNFLKSDGAIQGVMNTLSLGSSFLSGAFVPQEFINKTVLNISKIFPSYYYIRNNNLIATDFDNAEITRNTIIMLIFMTAFIVVNILIKSKKKKAN